MRENGTMDFEELEFFDLFKDLKKSKFEEESFFLTQEKINEKRENFQNFLEPYSQSVLRFDHAFVEAKVLSCEKKLIVSKAGKSWTIFNLQLRDLKDGNKFYPAVKFFDTKHLLSKRSIQAFEDIFEVNNRVKVELKGAKDEAYNPIDGQFLNCSIGKYYFILSDEQPKEHQDDRPELFFKTSLSQLESVLKDEQIIEYGNNCFNNFVGVCDTGGFYSYFNLEKIAKKMGVDIVYGTTLHCRGKNKKVYRLLFYPKNQEAMKLLYKQFSIAWSNGNYNGSPILEWNQVQLLRESDVFILLPSFIGEATASLFEEDFSYISEIINKVDGFVLSPLGQHCIYLEKPNQFIIKKENYNKDFLSRGLLWITDQFKQNNKPVFLTNYPSAITKEEETILEMILFTERKEDFSRTSRRLLTNKQLKEEFSFFIKKFGKKFYDECVFTNPNNFFAQIDKITFEKKDLSLPVIPMYDDQDAELERLSYKGMEDRYGENWRDFFPGEIKERLEFELKSIMGKYSVVYLASLLAIQYSLDRGYPVGSRGSVGSSLVAFLIGVSDVNPLPIHYYCKHCKKYIEFVKDDNCFSGWDLPKKKCPVCKEELIRDGFDIKFSTFMGYDGDKVADIDLNFSGTIQKDVMSYIGREIFDNSAFRVGTIMRIQEHSLVGVLTRLLGCNEAKIRFYAQLGSGIKKSFGKHPGGLMVIPLDKKYEEFSPLNLTEEKNGEGVFTTHFEYTVLHDNLLKMDILASDSIEFLYLLENSTNVKHDEIDFFSDEILKVFQDGDTLGINEFTTENAIKMLEEIKPTKWQHLCSMSGLQHGTGVWQGNARDIILGGEATIDEVDGCRDDIVEKLTLLLDDGAIAFKIVESVRKGRGIPKEFQKLTKSKIPVWYYNFIDKIQYMFPKAHAVAYLSISAKQAWYKKNYPDHFYAAYLSMKMRKSKLVKDTWAYATHEELDNEIIRLKLSKKEKNVRNKASIDKKIIICTVIQEIRERGIKITNPHPNFSLAEEFAPMDGNIASPLTVVPHLGFQVANDIVKERNEKGNFKDFLDLYGRSKIDHKAMIKLHSYRNFDVWSEKKRLLGDTIRKNLRKSQKNNKIVFGLKKAKGK